MWKPSAYDWVYPLSYLFTFSIATPHSILVQLSFPGLNLKQGAASLLTLTHQRVLGSSQLGSIILLRSVITWGPAEGC